MGLREAVADEADDMVQCRIVTQLQLLVALDPIRLTDLREQLRLLHRVDPQIRLQIQIQIQQLSRIPRLLRHQRHHPRHQLLPHHGSDDATDRHRPPHAMSGAPWRRNRLR